MAFIWDSSRLEFEAAQDCELVTAGELFGRSGYGIGLQKGSPWADAVTLAILDFHESEFRYPLRSGFFIYLSCGKICFCCNNYNLCYVISNINLKLHNIKFFP